MDLSVTFAARVCTARAHTIAIERLRRHRRRHIAIRSPSLAELDLISNLVSSIHGNFARHANIIIARSELN